MFAARMLRTLKSAAGLRATHHSRPRKGGGLHMMRRMRVEPLEQRQLLSASADGLAGTLYSPNLASDTGFGNYLAPIGDDLLIGPASSSDRSGYRFDVPSGNLIQTYTAPLPGTHSCGYAVGTMGDDVLMRGTVNFVLEDPPHEEVVYLFDGDTAQVIQTFVAPEYNNDSGPAPMVGYGNLLLVGTPSVNYWPDESYYFSEAGAVYVFDVQTGDLVTALTDPTPGDYEHFGRGIAVRDTTIYITSESSEQATPENAVAVWAFDAFDPDPSNWTITQSFEKPGIPDPAGSERWGHPLLLLGDGLFIGAVYDDPGAENAGAVHVFDINSADYLTTWSNPDPQPAEYFGRSLTALGDQILVGATGDQAVGSPSGSAFLFDGAGNLIRTYLDPHPDVNDRFGVGIAAVGDHVAIGDLYDDAQGDAEGAVHLFRADPAGIHVAPLLNLVISEDGTSSAQFNVVLNTQPACDVVLNMSINDPSEGVLSTTQLRFTSANWNQLQTVSVTGLEDNWPDEDQTFAVDFAPSSSDDGTYNDLQIRSISVTCVDSMTVNQTFSSGAVNLDIPDPHGQYAGHVESTLEVTEAGTIRDLNLRLDITHARATEIHVHLVSPAGTYVQLINGNASGNYTSSVFSYPIILDDEAPRSITDYAAGYPTEDTFSPESPLEAFDGEQIQGTWTLFVFDDTRKTLGTLNEWALYDVAFTPTVPNDPPVAVDDSYAVTEDGLLSVSLETGVLENDTDSDGPEPLTAKLGAGPSNGSLTLNSDGSFTYEPDPDFNGTDSFTYVANDGLDDSNVAIVTIMVDPLADPPLAVDDAYSTPMDTAKTMEVLTNDSDPDGDSLSVMSVSLPSNGTAVINADNTITYTPNSGFIGIDTFDYTISDGNGGTDTATVSIEVSAANAETALYVYDIHFESKAGGKFWQAVFEIRGDSNGDGQGTSADAAVAGVAITVEFAGQTYTGTTDSDGIFRTDLVKGLSSGDHYAQVVDLAMTDYFWDPLLDLEDDTDGDGFADDVLSL
jgi:subtilisin-like proprotein convertase family protein